MRARDSVALSVDEISRDPQYRPTALAENGPVASPPHPRTIGWAGTTALAMGGSNQSLFLIGALVASQGSAAIPLLILGLLLSLAAAPGWTELILMWPNRVGGIAATCAEAFRPYSPVLANLTGVCYWWGWVPTCGLTAILSATALKEWYLPDVPVAMVATLLVLFFTAVNLSGVKWVTRLALPIATVSATLAFLSGLIPVLTGHVNWHQATTFHLLTPFSGVFGQVTSAMAGLYLVGFAAPAFEAATCHVGETVDPERNVPRAMLASAAMATLYFLVLPVVWLGALGTGPLEGNLQEALGPAFAPLLGNGARSAAVWFMMFNMFHGTLQPLAGAARTLMQIAEDGLLPRVFALRSRTDAPWVATLVTAGMAILFLQTGDPTWVIAAANLAYLIGIAMPNVAVWLLRRDAPQMARPYRAPRGTIVLGLIAALTWAASALLGFEQFGLLTVLAGIALCYSGTALYALRCWNDRRRAGLRGRSLLRSLHVKLTGAMLLVLALDGGGYVLAVSSMAEHNTARITALEDIFVAVAVLTISVGLILPGMVAQSASEITQAAAWLAEGTLADLRRAMQALSRGDLDGARARVDMLPVTVRTRDELGVMAASFATMQQEVAETAIALGGAREGLRLAQQNAQSALRAVEANERRLSMQYAAVRALAEVSDLSLSMPRVIEAVCESFGWTLGNFWVPDGNVLRCHSMWHPESMENTDFVKWARTLTLTRGEALPGVVWEVREPRWVIDVQQEPAFGRRKEVTTLGLHTVFCFPIMGSGQCHGVLEFFAQERREPRSAMIEAITALGTVIASAIEHSAMQDALRVSEEGYRSLVETSPDGILAVDPAGKIRTANRRAAELFRFASAEAMLGNSIIDLIASEDGDRAQINLHHRAHGVGAEGRETEYSLLRRDGTVFPGEISSTSTAREDGTEGTIVAIVRDITDRRQAEDQLRYQALHDSLTRLPNRTLSHDRLEQAILAARYSGTSMALLLMDLDRFKDVNDTLGHAAGDALLQEVAIRLEGTVRESDTVARLGGDEFAVILPGADQQRANAVAEQIRSTLREPLVLEGNRIDIDASIGIALYPVHGTDASTLLRRADVAMYAAKRAGDNHRIYAPDQDLNSPARLALVADLRDAIDGDQLLLHYQPKVDIRTGAVEQVEALVRWKHPEHGLIPPGEFITIAEETGLMEPLTLWVLKTALKQCADWRQAGLHLSVAVNLSARNLHDARLPDTILWLLRGAAVDASALTVEITESSLMENPAAALVVLTRLHEMGLTISIDDFGTGYSSLAYLKQLPADEIKIDRSFVLGMTRNETVIVRSVIDLAQNLGLQVTAEGVEDEEMFDMLARMGCDMAQGYYISRPLPAADLTTWLMARRRDRGSSAAGQDIIMVVDDNPVYQELVQVLLSHEGYQVVTVGNAEDAFAALRRITPNLVLTDVRLPDMSGLELARQLRMQPQLRDASIVAFTSAPREADQRYAESIGCDMYTAKPSKNRDVVQIVREQLSLPARRDGQAWSDSSAI